MKQEQLKEVNKAIKQICDEKGIDLAVVVETIESALAAAYRKDFGNKNQNIKIDFNLETGEMKAHDIKIVMEKPPEEEAIEDDESAANIIAKVPAPKSEGHRPTDSQTDDEVEEDAEPRFNPKLNISPEEAQPYKKDAQIGDEIRIELPVPGDFGRMAAQTAKQVIIQKLREAEREMIYKEFKDQEGEVIVGTVQRQEGYLVLVDFGRATAILPPEEQIERERYRPGARLKFYVISVETTAKGPEIVVSRSHPEIVRKLFETEVPEVASGAIAIKAIAREAGWRSKVAVESKDENIDPIGSCVGQRGIRAQTIISELGGEKVDIIEYNNDPAKYIANALSPAKILNVEVDAKSKTARVKVKEDQLSLAIGKNGQNVRLASKLTGWRVDIIKETGAEVKPEETAPAAAAGETAAQEEKQEPGEKSEEKEEARKEKTTVGE